MSELTAASAPSAATAIASSRAIDRAANCARFSANIAALWEHQSPLALDLEAIADEALYALQPTPGGPCTVAVPDAAGAEVLLHSRRDPVGEARRWAGSLDVSAKYVVVLNGFGLGYHAAALWDQMPKESLLIIAEPDLRLLRTALENADFSEMLGAGRVIFFNELSRAKLVEQLEPRSTYITSGTLLAAHAPSVRLHPEFHRQFLAMFTEFAEYTRTGLVTLMLNNVATCRNVANNLGRYVTAAPLGLLRGAFANQPAILVAAGPSLQKNMHLLPAVAENAVIICVQTILKPLLAAGITPDFVTALDYHTISTRFFENLRELPGGSDVHLVAETKAHPKVLDLFSGGMSLAANDFANKILRDAAPCTDALKAGSTVAHLSFYLAQYLGCDPIILIGQDLGFVDGLYYKPGTAIHDVWAPELDRFHTLETREWERIVRGRRILRRIKDIYGADMYTEELFFTYLQQFERDFAASRAQVIDATEGGARKEGTTVATLQETLQRYCRTPLDKKTRSAPWKTFAVDASTKLSAAAEALAQREADARRLLDHCRAVLPLLRRMLAEQENSAVLDQLFVKVDHLRARVSADIATLEMASSLNTIGELRRFYHDVSVRAAPEDSLLRQRRQIERDIDNVQQLAVGCQRLLEIIGEATVRIIRQQKGMANGQPWPVEDAA